MDEVGLQGWSLVVRGQEFVLILDTDCGQLEQEIVASDWMEASAKAEEIVQQYDMMTA